MFKIFICSWIGKLPDFFALSPNSLRGPFHMIPNEFYLDKINGTEDGGKIMQEQNNQELKYLKTKHLQADYVDEE